MFFFLNKHICKCQILKIQYIYIYLKLCLAWSVLKVLLAWVRVSRFETDCHITPKGGHTSSLLQIGSLSNHLQVIRLSGTFIYNLSACRCWLISICVSFLGFLVWYVAKVCKDAWKMCLPQFISLNSYSISFQAVCEYFQAWAEPYNWAPSSKAEKRRDVLTFKDAAGSLQVLAPNWLSCSHLA